MTAADTVGGQHDSHRVGACGREMGDVVQAHEFSGRLAPRHVVEVAAFGIAGPVRSEGRDEGRRGESDENSERPTQRHAYPVGGESNNLAGRPCRL